mgnify:CR=1 FL=1|jgi:PTH1 family peptidyl-tRNA hydrolase
MLACVVGLGNPTPAHAGSRHNVGYAVLDAVAVAHGVRWRRYWWRAYWLARQRQGDLLLCKPATFMNRSGAAVTQLYRRHALAPAQLLVVYDDMDLPLGALRVRAAGSAGGHKGMQSVLTALGTEQVPRLRLGIGPGSGDPIAHVLGRFTPEEQPRADRMITTAARAVTLLLTAPWNTAVQRIHSWPSAQRDDDM